MKMVLLTASEYNPDEAYPCFFSQFLHLLPKHVYFFLKGLQKFHYSDSKRGWNYIVCRLIYICIFYRINIIILTTFMTCFKKCIIGNNLIDIHIYAGTGTSLYCRNNEMIKIVP